MNTATGAMAELEVLVLRRPQAPALDRSRRMNTAAGAIAELEVLAELRRPPAPALD